MLGAIGTKLYGTDRPKVMTVNIEAYVWFVVQLVHE